MKFETLKDVQEAFDIIYGLWGKSWTVYSPMEINKEDLTISFTADGYFDPILTLFTLHDRNIVEAKFEWAGEEKDKVIISGCNLEILKNLALIKPFPEYNTIKSVLDNLYPQQEKRNKPDPPHIILGDDFIPIKDWKDYWALQGKDGPSSGWEIPTKEKLYEAIRKL